MPFISGLDLGQAGDFAAQAICEQTEGPHPLIRDRRCWHYAIRYLKRWPLGTLYVAPEGQPPGVMQDVQALYERPPLAGSMLAVDRTGVGRAGVDQLRAMGIKACICGLTYTAGAEHRRDGWDWWVPKKDLAGTFRECLESGCITVAKSLPLAKAFEEELTGFKVRQSAKSGHESFEGIGTKDDLTVAAMMAVWLGEQFSPWGAGSIGTPAGQGQPTGRDRPAPNPFGRGLGGRFGYPPPGVFDRGRGRR